MLALHTTPDESSARDAVDFVVVLNQEQHLVLVAEIKDDKWVNIPEKRWRADTQTHQLYDQLLPPNCHIPGLYGLGLLGTSLRVYCGDILTGEATPHFVTRSNTDRILLLNFLGSNGV